MLIFHTDSILDPDGVSVELTPLTVRQKVGETVRFTCTYHGSEPMAIDFEKIRRPQPQHIELYAPLYSFMGPADLQLEHLNKRYKNKDEQSIDIVITPDLIAVKCRIQNVDGMEVAMVMSHITKGLNFI